MPNVYTDFLYGATGVIPGDHRSTVVPDGFVWDLRCIDIAYEGANQAFDYLQGFTIDDQPGGYPIFRKLTSGVIATRAYHWEGRQLLKPGHQIRVFTNDDGWSWKITGYVLTLP